MLGLMADRNLADVRSPGTRLDLEPIHCPPNPRCAPVRLVVAFPAVLHPFTPSPYQNGHMELPPPGGATLSRDPDEPARGAGDAETADVALAASGDGRAFERLYRAHVARVHSLARRMIGFDVADDVTQDVFVRAWTKLGTFRGEAAFGTWLHRLAINVILARRTSLGTERGRYHDGEDVLDAVPSRPVVNELSLEDRKSTRLNSSHGYISYAVFCLKKKKSCTSRCRKRRLPPQWRGSEGRISWRR